MLCALTQSSLICSSVLDKHEWNISGPSGLGWKKSFNSFFRFLSLHHQAQGFLSSMGFLPHLNYEYIGCRHLGTLFASRFCTQEHKFEVWEFLVKHNSPLTSLSLWLYRSLYNCMFVYPTTATTYGTQIKVRGIAWKHRNIYSFSLLSTRAEQQVKSQGLREHPS